MTTRLLFIFRYTPYGVWVIITHSLKVCLLKVRSLKVRSLMVRSLNVRSLKVSSLKICSIKAKGERVAIADDSVSFADVRIENSSKIFRCRPLYFPRTFKIRIFQMSEEYDVFSASKCNYSIFFLNSTILSNNEFCIVYILLLYHNFWIGESWLEELFFLFKNC